MIPEILASDIFVEMARNWSPIMMGVEGRITFITKQEQETVTCAAHLIVAFQTTILCSITLIIHLLM